MTPRKQLTSRKQLTPVKQLTQLNHGPRPAARAISFWYAQIDPPPRPRDPLTGSREADVCIVGAGFTGLWTAYYLRRADPSLEVVVLEAEVAGFGASGRNGGWAEGRVAGAREHWADLGGRPGAMALERAMFATVDEIGKVTAAEGIDCAFQKGGTLTFALSPLQLGKVRAEVEGDRMWGLGPEDSVLLDGPAAAERIAVDGVLGARYSPHCARVQPAKLAVGLAAAAERAGATIYEGTRVTAIEPGLARTASGAVRAKFVVRATEGYTRSLAGQRRVILPASSTMIVTEVLSPDIWAALHWREGETFLDATRRYVYVKRTGDGRIALGGRGRPYRYASQTDAETAPESEAVRALRQRLIELFPVLSDVTLDGAWQGVLGSSREWAPAVGLDRDSGIAWGGAYSGEGVAAANLAGRTLADLILGRDTELTHLPWVRPLDRQWPPEPFRYIGVRGVNKMMAVADQREWRTDRTSVVGRLAHVITGRNLG
jgi:glycine/D-amino acid oxidase-like deaminating enzyme